MRKSSLGRRSHRGKILAAVGLAGTLALAACGGSSSSSSSSASAPSASSESAVAAGSSAPSDAESAEASGALPGEGKTIGLVMIVGNEFVTGAVTGILNELVPAGYDVKILNSNFDPEAEIANFDALIAQGVDGIITMPVTAASAARGAVAAQKAGIPSINMAWNTGPDDDVWAGRLLYNYEKDTQQIADWLSANATPGEVLVIQGAPGVPTSDAFDSVAAKIDALGGDWKVVGMAPGGYTRDGAITATQNLMTAHPNAKIIISAAAEMGVGVATYLDREGITDMVTVTTDGNGEMVDWMKKGVITSDLYLSGGGNGVRAAQMARGVLEDGMTFPEVEDMPMSMETGETIDAAVAADPMVYPEYLDQAKSGF